MGNSLAKESRTPVLELHLSPGPVHSFPGALENPDFATLRMKRRVKDGETLLLLHGDGWLCYLQGLPTRGAAATPWGLPAGGQGPASVLWHWQRQNRQWTHGSVSAARSLLANLNLGARKPGVRPQF